MSIDLGTVTSFLKLLFMNKTALMVGIGVFVGWNLPQPAVAKFVQDKVVQFFGYLWNKATNRI